MRILVTGGAGFLGTNLIKRLISEGHYVVCVDNLYSGSVENLDLFLGSTSFRFINKDINKMDSELDIPGEIDWIFHLACPASPPRYQKEPIFTFRTSVVGTENILKLAMRKKARMLFSSTSECYGDPLEHPQKESYRGNVNTTGPRACYDEGKRAAETLCYEYFQLGADVRIVRIFNTYGPYMDPDDGRVVSTVINQALRKEAITLFGSGEQTRSFCYVDDLIEGFIRYMKLEGRFLGPINLGNPCEFSVNELAKTVLKLIPESTSDITYLPLPKDDPTKRKPDIFRAKQFLDWEPKIPLEEGLVKTIEYFRSLIEAGG